MKYCPGCEIEKEETEFHKNRARQDGLAPHCKECKNAMSRERTASVYGIEYNRRFRVEQYGITLEEYNDMFIEQDGCCAICGIHQSELNYSLCVDHNHETGNVRGLLCRGCNANLGIVETFRELADKYLFAYDR